MFLVAAFLAGGYYESTTALLAAAVWLGLAVAASFGAARRPSAAFIALAGLAVWSLLSGAWGPLGPALASTPLLVLYAGVLLAAEWLPREPALRALTWATALVCLACVVVLSTIVAYLLYYSAVARIDPSKVAAFMYFQPIVASLIAFLVAGEGFSRTFLFGGGLVLAGVLLAEWS